MMQRHRPHLREGLCTAHLLPSSYELQHIGLSVAHFITEALGSSQPSEHAAADDGILLSQAAAAVNWAHAPHLSNMTTLSCRGEETDRQTDRQTDSEVQLCFLLGPYSRPVDCMTDVKPLSVARVRKTV